MPMGAWAATTVDSGKCGDDLTWVLDSEGTLMISGEGTMYDYINSYFDGIYRTSAPWGSYYKDIKSVVIESGIANIGNCAFSYCSGIESLVISNSVKRIGNNAFSECRGLTSVTIPDGVESIEDFAFHDCSSLTSLSIPSSVTSIGDSIMGCFNLTELKVDDENCYYSCEEGVLFNKDKTKLIWCLEGKTGTYSIPDSVISIESYAFSNCNKLTSVAISDSVTTIGRNAFLGCLYLTTVTIGDNVETIDYEAFSNCWRLSDITIPNSVTSIGDGVFERCESLTSIVVEENNKHYSSSNGVLFNIAKPLLLRYPCGTAGDYIVPDSVTS